MPPAKQVRCSSVAEYMPHCCQGSVGVGQRTSRLRGSTHRTYSESDCAEVVAAWHDVDALDEVPVRRVDGLAVHARVLRVRIADELGLLDLRQRGEVGSV